MPSLTAGREAWADSGPRAQDNNSDVGVSCRGSVRAPALAAAEGPLSLLRVRSFRVSSMLVVLWLLSMTDLALTMTYVTGFGMFEANPVVVKLIGEGSPAVMVTWKLMTLGLTMLILFGYRARWQSEVGTILCVGVMSALLVHWHGYMRGVEGLTNEMAVLGNQASGLPGLEGADVMERPYAGAKWVSVDFATP